MTNLDFTLKLQALIKANNRSNELLQECEAEYERRYGVNPSDANDDMWIENFHGFALCSPNSATFKTVNTDAVEYAGLKSFLGCYLGRGRWDHNWEEKHYSSGGCVGGRADEWTWRECRDCGITEDEFENEK